MGAAEGVLVISSLRVEIDPLEGKFSGPSQLWSFSNGELLIVTGEDKLLHDPKNDSFRFLEICNGKPGSNCGLSATLNYVESLVSPNYS
ncbi:hypothetical protein C5167_031780 [Papaver somniferum]|uniref:Uncharacterized protein n=1 Tax=Papaver somniferum TaxID=3469 RepID=A0A4Y7K989_PAPSO|nr:hypothetical protein C5167_031780 [Papaver somniferum]